MHSYTHTEPVAALQHASHQCPHNVQHAACCCQMEPFGIWGPHSIPLTTSLSFALSLSHFFIALFSVYLTCTGSHLLLHHIPLQCLPPWAPPPVPYTSSVAGLSSSWRALCPSAPARHLLSGSLPIWSEVHWCHANAGSGCPYGSTSLHFHCLSPECCHQSRVCPWVLLSHSTINLRRLNNEHEAPAIWGISSDHDNGLTFRRSWLNWHFALI